MTEPALIVLNSSALPHTSCRLDEALLQNAVADVLADDLGLLADEEAEGLGGSSSSSAGANGSSRAGGGGGSGGRQEHVLTEAQSFTDLTYSKNKVGWHCRLQLDCTKLQWSLSIALQAVSMCRVCNQQCV